MDDQKQGLLVGYSFHLRKATLKDMPAIQALTNLSVRILHPPFYSPSVINLALEQASALDPTHVTDGNYFIVEIKPSDASPSLPTSPEVVGCGGWSHRSYSSDPHNSRDSQLLNPSTDAAKVRSVFVHPDWTRKGIASMVLRTCEEAAREAGFRRVELRASLQAVAFYGRMGYEKMERIEKDLGGGEVLELVFMRKSLI